MENHRCTITGVSQFPFYVKGEIKKIVLLCLYKNCLADHKIRLVLTRLAKVVCLQLPDESDRFVGAAMETNASLSSKDLSPALSTLCRLKDVLTFPRHLGILLLGLAAN